MIATDILDFISGIMDGVSEEDIQNLLEKSGASNLAGTVPDGGEFMFCGVPFIRLGEEQGGILCITKQDIFRSRFHDTDNNDYRESIVRHRLLEEFLPLLDCEELLPFEMNLASAVESSQGYGVCADYVGILTEELYRKYRRYIRMDGYMWLCTPFSLDRRYPYVRYVNASGNVSSSNAYSALRCRPACIFKKSS